MMDIYSRKMSKEITQAILGGQTFAGDAMPRKGGIEAEMGGNPFDHMYSTLKETKNQVKSVSRKAGQLYQAVGRAISSISNTLTGQPVNSYKITTSNLYNASETNEPSNSFTPKSIKDKAKRTARKFSNTVKLLRGKPINVYKGTPVTPEANVNAPDLEQSTNQPRNINNEREPDEKASIDRATQAQKNSFSDELTNKLAERRKKIDQQSDNTSNN